MSLNTKRVLKSKKSELETKADEYAKQIAKLEKQKAKLEPVMKKLGATKIQKVMRGHMGRKQFMMNKLENEIQRTENMLDSTRKNINEQRPEGLRRKIKQLQDKKSDLITRQQGLTRDTKKEELKKVNQELQHYENIIMKRKPGPKVRETVEQYEGMAKRTSARKK